MKRGGGSFSEPRVTPAAPAGDMPSAPVHETGGRWGALPSILLVCQHREGSGFLESKMSWCTKGHAVGFHHRRWEWPCATAPLRRGCVGTGKLAPGTGRLRGIWGVQGSRGTLNPARSFLVSGIPFLLAFAAHRRECVFRSSPGVIRDTPGLWGRFPVPSGAPERLFQHFMPECRLC